MDLILHLNHYGETVILVGKFIIRLVTDLFRYTTPNCKHNAST